MAGELQFGILPFSVSLLCYQTGIMPFSSLPQTGISPFSPYTRVTCWTLCLLLMFITHVYYLCLLLMFIAHSYDDNLFVDVEL